MESNPAAFFFARNAAQSNSQMAKRSGSACKRGSAGPRTPTGKKRSKLNAIKHGLFSQVVVLDHESQSEYEKLLAGVRHTLVPVGPLEETLADKISVILWRYRRFIQAERATVQTWVEVQQDRDAEMSIPYSFVSPEQECREGETNRLGFLRFIDEDRQALERCLDKLAYVLESVKTYGLAHGRIKVKLGVVYGARYAGRPGHDLYDYYLECLRALNSTVAERKALGFDSEIACVDKFTRETEREIERIESHRKGEPPPLPDVYKPDSLSVHRAVIPARIEMDRLLRYESHLDRMLRHSLIQLQMVQVLRENQGTILVPRNEKTGD